MKNILYLFAEITLVFILTILVLFAISLKEPENISFQAYDGDLLSSNPLTKNIPTIKNKNIENNYFSRIFKWTDSNKQTRNTILKIGKNDLKKEIKIFGLKKGMKDSLFLNRRGFKIVKRRNEIINGQIIEKVKFIVDYKTVYERNIPYFTKITAQLINSIPVKNFNPIYSFLKFVQYIPYKKSPSHYSGKFINKFFVPLVCLYEQSGDCDSKSLLLSELLTTYPNSKEKLGIVLVYGQGIAHAVLAIKKKPLMGMTSLLVKGDGYYILLETTHKRWSPGFISYRVGKAIKAGFVRFVALN